MYGCSMCWQAVNLSILVAIQVKGLPGALYQGFDTHVEAQAWIDLVATGSYLPGRTMARLN